MPDSCSGGKGRKKRRVSLINASVRASRKDLLRDETQLREPTRALTGAESRYFTTASVRLLTCSFSYMLRI